MNEFEDLANTFRGVSGSNYSDKAKITKFQEQTLPPEVLSIMANMLAAPDFLYQWKSVNPKAVPTPSEIPKAVLHVKILKGRAWIDGDLINNLKNKGDVDFLDTVQDKLGWKENETSDKLSLIKDVKKTVGKLAKGNGLDWNASWRVEGGVSILKALFQFFTTKSMKVVTTSTVSAKYKVPGTLLFIFPAEKTQNYSKSFTVEGVVPVRNLDTDITAW